MNLQAQMSGQISEHVPNQGTIPSQNGNAQMQNLGGPSGPSGSGVGPPRNPGGIMDNELLKLRQYMRTKIFNILQPRQPSPADDASRAKFMDVARRLEEGLLKMAVTKEDYVNPQTLEARLTNLIRNRQLNSYNQRQANPSSSFGTMIPTPGLPYGGGNQNLIATSVDSSTVGSNSTTTTVVNTGNLSNGYQQSSVNFSVGSGGNTPSMGSQRVSSQMIPTPGFNNSSNFSNANGNSESYMISETNNSGSCTAFESINVQQPSQQQRQQTGGQNSRILHNLGSQVGSGIRSGMQQKSYGLINGSVSGGSMGMNGNNLQLVNEPRTSESFVGGPPHTNSTRNMPMSFDNIQRLGVHGEGYTTSTSDPFGSGNTYEAVTSVGLQNYNSMSQHSVSTTNSAFVSSQSNQQVMQQGLTLKHESVDPSENLSFQSALAPRQHLLQPHQHKQVQQQTTNQFQQHQRFVNQHQEKLMKNDGYDQTQLTPDLVPQVKHESRLHKMTEVTLSHGSERFQMPQLQNQLLNCAEDRNIGSQIPSGPTNLQDICSRMPLNAEQSQRMLEPQHFSLESHNGFTSSSVGFKFESSLQDPGHIQLQGGTQMARSMSNEQHIQEDFRQRILGRDEAQQNLSEGSGIVQSHASGITSVPKNPMASASTCRPENGNQDPRFRNQQRWLLFLRHARTCKAPEGKCQDPNCITAQRLWRHMDSCDSPHCTYPRCHHTKTLINHHRNCKDHQCPVCIPVRNYLQQHAKARALARFSNDSGLPSSNSGSGKSKDTELAFAPTISAAASCADTTELPQPATKRLKPELSAQPAVPETEHSTSSVAAVTETKSSYDTELYDYQHGDACEAIKSEAFEVKVEVPVVPFQRNPVIGHREDNAENMTEPKTLKEPLNSDERTCLPKQRNVKLEREIEPTVKDNPPQPCEPSSKSGKPEIKGVSLTELFTPQQVREHIRGLRQWVGQSKAKAEKIQAMENSMSENSCQLCAVEKLTFEPPPIYCTPCGARIKRNAMYYTVGSGDARHYFCIPCYNESRGDSIVAEGASIPKARLEKKKNDEETEEWWVQCDKCEAWQHQICALFNGRRNDGGQAEYTCPNCYIAEVERGERKPLPQSAVLGAKDLPKTILSDHIEQRLFRRLKQERTERARVQGKSYDEVPGAEALVVRVVSSVDKKLEVKPRFLEIFREENYPTEFPYKSKVVLLFQKIEGVEVCLFGMYVQEFGTECDFPNQRRVYLSYLDSVKYFRPEIRAVSGEALRTFVYHEILIGYLEYCKLRGFTSCYIWACPPLKGEDYILYCHPEIQKTPKSDKLREWYLSMLRKAAKERIVVECTNLYDHFFIQTGECRAKVTAARLPYFDGDYWPGAAEDIIHQMNQEEDGRKSNKKGTIKKTITKRALKATGQSDLFGNASKDLLLMHKLGESIYPMKEDFIMVHLQYCCTQCCILMVSGIRWVCDQCKNFQICDSCFEAEQKREGRERHPVNQKEKHTFYPVEIADVATDTKDEDEILESEFFDTRQAFLSLCQGNHYQYDTLRRAKHSSMMVLYHLHNPTAPAFVTTCNVCHLDIETGQGWRCEVCPDFDVCNACYSKNGGINHPHKLTNHPSLADQNAQNQEARQLRVLQLRKMLDLLVHASQCRSPNCQYPNCRKVKGLFRHGIQCRVRASGGCVLCKKMWYLLQLHARACKESKCHVPRCKDLKEHLRRLQQQSDSRRRAAVMEMMRQRAAEVAGNSG